jgi:hypothetical protein
MSVAKHDLVNGEGEDINEPIVGSVAKDRLTVSKALCYVCGKSLTW